jgi:flagellar biosynthetic protein FliQ
MNNQQFIDVILSLLYVTIEISLPILGTALFVGLVISVFQAATQINESTLSFLPKIAAIVTILIILSPWIVRKITDFTHKIYDKIPEFSLQKK